MTARIMVVMGRQIGLHANDVLGVVEDALAVKEEGVLVDQAALGAQALTLIQSCHMRVNMLKDRDQQMEEDNVYDAEEEYLVNAEYDRIVHVAFVVYVHAESSHECCEYVGPADLVLRGVWALKHRQNEQ